MRTSYIYLMFIFFPIFQISCIPKAERVCENQQNCLGTFEKTRCFQNQCLPELCTPNTVKSCSTHDNSKTGQCKPGKKYCIQNGTQWTVCLGEQKPVEETCDLSDNDCDGKIDEDLNCSCKTNSWRLCQNPYLQNSVCNPGIQQHQLRWA